MILKYRHQDQVSALTQYLWEDYLRNSDVGEAAKIQAAREEKERAKQQREAARLAAQAEKAALRKQNVVGIKKAVRRAR